MKNNFARNLTLILADKRWSQEETAKAIGVSQKSISLWTRGVTEPPVKHLISLCEVFKVSISELVSGEYLFREVA